MALALAALFIDSAPDWDWGDVPTWIASLATSAALLITAVTLRRDQHDRRERDEREQSQQARGVHLKTIELQGSSGSTHEYMDYDFKLEFTNNSEDVIHAIEVGIDAHPETVVMSFDRKRLRLAHLGVGQTRFFRSQIRVTWLIGVKQDDLPTTFETLPYFRFTDIEGRRWERDAEYRLTRI